MPVSTTLACLNISKHRFHKSFYSTSMSKLKTGYDLIVVKSHLSYHGGSVALSQLNPIYKKGP